jgi:hypothetical protein
MAYAPARRNLPSRPSVGLVGSDPQPGERIGDPFSAPTEHHDRRVVALLETDALERSWVASRLAAWR